MDLKVVRIERRKVIVIRLKHIQWRIPVHVVIVIVIVIVIIIIIVIIISELLLLHIGTMIVGG